MFLDDVADENVGATPATDAPMGEEKPEGTDGEAAQI